MKCYIEKNYGADADGNRGIYMEFYELEPSDYEEVKEKVIEELNGYDEDDYPETVTITMICPHTEEDIDFEVDVKDYL